MPGVNCYGKPMVIALRTRIGKDQLRNEISEATAAALQDVWEAVSSRAHAEAYQRISDLLLRLCFLVYADESVGLPRFGDAPGRLHDGFRGVMALQESPDAWRNLAELWDRIAEANSWHDDSVAAAIPAVAGGLSVAQSLLSQIGELARSGDMPATTLFGAIQQTILDHEPVEGEAAGLRRGTGRRKTHGAFYTPEALVSFSVGRALGPLLKKTKGVPAAVLSLTVFDPACGTGVFLSEAAAQMSSYLAKSAGNEVNWRSWALRNCVYAVESDLSTVVAARLALWLEAGDPELPLSFLNAHVQHRNTLLGYRSEYRRRRGRLPGVGDHQLTLREVADESFRWDEVFPQVLGRPNDGFAAVVGNPPYVAAKNQDLRHYEEEWGIRGQSDLYVLFFCALTGNGLLRRGGRYCMVLPDPVLSRENAKPVREILLTQWGLDSLLHIRGLFRDAVVANAVLAGPAGRKPRTVRCARVESSESATKFAESPATAFRKLAARVPAADFARQPRMEFSYLVSGDFAAKVISFVHGQDWRLGHMHRPFRPLGEIPGVEVYRGEEIGKSSVRAGDGELPILLGGESLAPYQITWEGHRIAESDLRKPLANYSRMKVLVQKSAPRPVAAVDAPTESHSGYVVPQSIYCIHIGDDLNGALYITALLNSSTIREYVFRCFTGYKMRQPQIEIEDLRRIPIRLFRNTTERERLNKLVSEGWAACLAGDMESLRAFCRDRLAVQPDEADVLPMLIVELARSLTFPGNNVVADGQVGIDVIVEAMYRIADCTL